MHSIILVPTLSLGTTEVFTVDEVWSEAAAFYFKMFFVENQSVFEYLHGKWQKQLKEINNPTSTWHETKIHQSHWLNDYRVKL